MEDNNNSNDDEVHDTEIAQANSGVDEAGIGSGDIESESGDGKAGPPKVGEKHHPGDDDSQEDVKPAAKKAKDEELLNASTKRSKASRENEKKLLDNSFEKAKFLFVLQDFEGKLKFPCEASNKDYVGGKVKEVMTTSNSYCILELQGFKGEGCPSAATRLSNPSQVAYSPFDYTQPCYFIDDSFSEQNRRNQKLKPLYEFKQKFGSEKKIICDPTFLVGLYLQSYMIQKKCSGDNIFFAKDSTLVNAYKYFPEYILQFIARNFKVFFLCPSALHQNKITEGLMGTWDVIIENIAKKLSNDYKTNIYPPIRLVNLIRNKKERDEIFAGLKIAFVMLDIPPSPTWFSLFQAAKDALVKGFSRSRDFGHVTGEKFIEENGIVAKAMRGSGAHSVFFMQLDKSDPTSIVVKNSLGAVIENVPSDMGKTFTFEPLISSFKTTELRCFQKVQDKTKFSKSGFYIQTTLNEKGQMTVVSVTKGCPEEFVKERISKRFFEKIGAHIGYQPLSGYKDLLFRIDIVFHEHGIDERTLYVGEVGLFPLCYLLLTNTEIDRDSFDFVVQAVFQFVKNNLLNWPK